MTAEYLRQLENQLWTAADQLRANSKLNATEYSFPVLGFIFLRHAYSRFTLAKAQIEERLPSHPQRGRRPVRKDDFLQAKAIFLPENAQWPHLAALPEGQDIGEALDEAMRAIEDEYEVLEGVLPKNYALFDKALLQQLVRIFNTELLDEVTGDVFGRIYEYFLNKFAMSGAQEGGEFFTPPSLVNAIVSIIEPDHGTVFDPACGSAGMFVQTGHFIEEEGEEPAEKVTFYGQEKSETNTKLAKMNMAVHGLDATILQGNTFYDDGHKLVGKCDFVMANPPFNVDGVDKKREAVKKDPRLPFGLPKNDNANYLWIQYFYSYLNPTGRAGFVMASSASDAGHSERAIREKLVKTNAVDVMVSIGTKFFYTRSLPCTLWFFDREKAADELRQDQTLMLDLREVYRKVSSNLHDFTPEHLDRIRVVTGLYREQEQVYEMVLEDLKIRQAEAWKAGTTAVESLRQLSKEAMEVTLTIEVEKTPGREDVQKLQEWKRQLGNEMRRVVKEAKEILRDKEFKKDKEKVEELKEWRGKVEAAHAAFCGQMETFLYLGKEIRWLRERFPDGKYVDVPGLCKVVDKAEIAENDYSLTPGRYVGVAPQIDEDFDYEARMAEIKADLKALNEEAVVLAEKVMANLEELGL